jgi:predicted transcriptional regulator
MTHRHRAFYDLMRDSWPDGQASFAEMRTRSVASLRAQGYSQTDISAFVGVSRERVRQWLRDAKPRQDSHHGTLPRVWDDEFNQFRALTRSEYRDVLREADRASRAEDRHLRQAARRRLVVNAAREFRVELGRDPTHTEIENCVGLHISGIASLFSGRPFQMTSGEAERYARPIRRFLRLAGISPRGVGGLGHVARSAAQDG